ncbi:MAG: metal-dependent transcriptional regulator [Lachnospiraceae bacterium]
MKRQESKEDYLETILILKNRISRVRSIDIVNEMGFTKPSVSVGMKNLREGGFITMDKEGYIALTTEGLQVAECVYERHTILTKALIYLGVSEEIAKADACRIEHDISVETFDRIKQHFIDKSGDMIRRTLY